MDIYVKPVKNVLVTGRGKVRLQDIAEVYAPADLLPRLRGIEVIDIQTGKKKSRLVSIIDIINAVDKAAPGHTIYNVGETDTVVSYAPEKRKDNPLWRRIKIAFVSLLLFSGSATAIMSFHSDAQIPLVFQNYYRLFFNEEEENPLILDLPYSIGLALGIIVFFNHFMGKKITDDPTPIEVEMSLYQGDVTDTKIDLLNREKRDDTED